MAYLTAHNFMIASGGVFLIALFWWIGTYINYGK